MIRGVIMDAIFEREMPRGRLAVLLKNADFRHVWNGFFQQF